MSDVYSTYEAKARFSEILRKVRAGRRVTISYRGKEVAEVRPIERRRQSVERSLPGLEEMGVISTARVRRGPPRPLAHKPGALARFLESRD
jgi:prevent-host-death family protein